MIELDGQGLTLHALDRVARGGEEVRLARGVTPRLLASRRVIERALAAHLPTYGVNTGFGELKNRHVGDEDLARLQLNLLRSHAAGVGRPLSVPEVRALGLLRANSLAVCTTLSVTSEKSTGTRMVWRFMERKGWGSLCRLLAAK